MRRYGWETEMLVSEAAGAYLEDRRARLRPHTVEGYESAIRRHVLPALGALDVAEVTFEAVQAWVDSIPTPGAALKAFKTFRQLYRWTLKRRQMRVWDVTQGIELPSPAPVERAVLTAPEERETAAGVEGEPFEAAVVLGAALGLRRCEACAVRVEDVDWRTGWVHVRRGVHWVGGGEVECPPKTRLSDRWVRLPSWALARLRAVRGRRRSGRLCAMPPHRAAAAFKRHCAARGLPWVPLSALRHSWATIAVAAGAAIEDVAVALGHSSVDMCVRRYVTDLRPVAARAAARYEAATGV